MHKYNDLKAQAVAAAARDAMIRKREEARRMELEALSVKHAKEVYEVEQKHDDIIAALQQELDRGPEALIELHEMAMSALAEAMSGDPVIERQAPTSGKRDRAKVDEEGASQPHYGKSGLSNDTNKNTETSKTDSTPAKKRQRRAGDADSNDMSFCRQLLDKITGPRYRNIASVFLEPVNPIELDIPTYFKVIEHSMDLSTIGFKLSNGDYHSPRAFKVDLDLMVQNSLLFNPRSHPVHGMGMDLSNVVDFMWSTGTTPDEVEGVECVHVEKIVKHRFDRSGELSCLVKWLGYDDQEDQTWEPVRNLGNSKELRMYFKKIGGVPAPNTERDKK
ncbi:transcription initiation at TATA-containing promoter protein [Recurvomyces mirabilis]|uniref:Transcription initiation at TATA-containing promoter protein n=1 Tax=Recurvomyces mirabilis TaxID=574656 RepID=A0AAE0WR21_9PEZI|nr:transcription initiation at TATA-containing promoter protein [Recurvomyces mirabilis]KAK5153859.1 transcription initiation at TATA-containing promoter protein [Recurvomyces mirabilis]